MELEDQLAIPVLPLRRYTNLLKSRRSLDSPAHAGDVARLAWRCWTLVANYKLLTIVNCPGTWCMYRNRSRYIWESNECHELLAGENQKRLLSSYIYIYIYIICILKLYVYIWTHVLWLLLVVPAIFVVTSLYLNTYGSVRPKPSSQHIFLYAPAPKSDHIHRPVPWMIVQF